MKDHSLNFLELVNESLKIIDECDIFKVKDLQDNKQEFVLIDVREDREWVQGHIPGSIHLGKGIIERDIERAVEDKEAMVILYCQGGYRSAIAGESINKMGYRNVYSMSGGFGDWQNNNFPIEVPQ